MPRDSSAAESRAIRSVAAAIGLAGCVIAMSLCANSTTDGAEFAFVVCFLLTAFFVLITIRTLAGSIRPGEFMDWLLPQSDQHREDD
ncbi:MAG: hypothetical protein Fues2KO_05830 [Fuerstiella sp.]